MTAPMSTLVVEYACTRSCSVEAAHVAAHEREAAKVFSPAPDVTVRAVALAEAVAR